MSNLQKRFFIAVPLGVVFGFVCAWLASSGAPGAFWWTALMWTIVLDRFLMGIVIGLAGVYTRHPILGFPFPAWLRGIALGILVSLPLASGGMITPNPDMDPWGIFWATLIAGAIYGLIIDLAATKWGGQGAELLK